MAMTERIDMTALISIRIVLFKRFVKINIQNNTNTSKLKIAAKCNSIILSPFPVTQSLPFNRSSLASFSLTEAKAYLPILRLVLAKHYAANNTNVDFIRFFRICEKQNWLIESLTDVDCTQANYFNRICLTSSSPKQ